MKQLVRLVPVLCMLLVFVFSKQEALAERSVPTKSTQTTRIYAVQPRAFERGFIEQFSKSADNWLTYNGTPWYSYGGYYFNQANKLEWQETMFYKQRYYNFDYQVRMLRRGASSYYTGMVVRDWLWFKYANNGWWQTEVCLPRTACRTIQEGRTSVINAYDWNVLRVVTSGTFFKFYINNKLISQGNVTGLKAGYVSITYFPGYKYERVWADNAVLIAK